MKLPATAAALSLALAAPVLVAAQTPPQFSDPANLRGERVSPRTGRELPIDQGALGLQQLLRKLSTRASILNIVAHPDDEDGGMLTLNARGLGARVADLALTRGEGGQNAVNGDFEDALGLLRTQELLANDRYTGVDQFFGTEVDFGFSKTKQEAFSKWTHERVLYDAVRAIRLYRPLVITATFIGGVTDGHGQHQVSGQIAQEAFLAAGDPKVFPDMIAEGILPWQPLKVYARVPSFAMTDKGLFDYATGQYVPTSFTNYVSGKTSTTPPTADVVIHEGQTDPLLAPAAASRADLPSSYTNSSQPLSYVQFARIGLGLQRTQIGPGVRLAASGPYDVSYHLYGSRLKDQPGREATFFDDIDTSVEGIATLAPHAPKALVQGLHQLQSQITAATNRFNSGNPAALGPALVDAQHDLGALLDQLEKAPFPGRANVLHELRIKQVQLNGAILCALGIQLEVKTQTATDDIPVGTGIAVKSRLSTNADEQIGIFSESVESQGGGRIERLLAVDAEPKVDASAPFQADLTVGPALTSAVTRPYFWRTDLEQPVYQLHNAQLRNAPSTPAPLIAWATMRYHQTEVRVGRVVTNDTQPLGIVPPGSVLLLSHAQVVLPKQTSVVVSLTVNPTNLRVEGELPKGWKITPDLVVKDAALGFKQMALQPPASNRASFNLRAVGVLPGGTELHEGFRPVGYPGLLHTNFFTPANTRIVPVDLNLPVHRRVAYLPGTGDAIPQAIASLDLPVVALTIADLTPAKLAQFDTVILGVRTYNAHPDLHGAPTRALLDFARSGGNVVVQFQTTEFTAADAPFPLALGSNEKVVDETAPVRLLDPSAPALTTPNRITPADFNGWIEERGHGFLQTWDSHYIALTETHDPGVSAEHVAPQLPQEGGLITAQLGRGHWTYVAFALYRQLPEAVPGAFRLFSNLLALADQPLH